MKKLSPEKEAFLRLYELNKFCIQSTFAAYERSNKTFNKYTFYQWKRSDEEFAFRLQLIEDYLLDIAEQQHKLLRDGIPINDEKGNLIGWQEKPDRAAIEYYINRKKLEKINQQQIEL